MTVSTTARSNCFKVRDAGAFKEWCTLHGLLTIGISEGFFTITPGSPGSDWPAWETPAGEEGLPTNKNLGFPIELSKHLAKDNVALLHNRRFDGSRFLSGETLAIRTDGTIHCVDRCRG